MAGKVKRPQWKYHQFNRYREGERTFRTAGEWVQIECQKRHIYSLHEANEFGAELDDVHFEIEDDYGSPTLVAIGWRHVTEGELLEFKELLNQEKEKNKEWEQKRLEQARQLLKEAGEI